jgi:hypothetical protein
LTTNSPVARLFDEFIEAQLSGGRPDVRDYLLRAGPASDQLGLLIDRFLELAPIEEPTEETIVVLNARLERVTPLTSARTRLALKIDELVERLGAALGLEAVSRSRLRTAYQELETDQLDPGGVHERVWEALRSILGLDPRRLIVGETPAFATSAYHRAADMQAAPATPSPSIREQTEPDQVDVLFRGGRAG